MRTNWTGTGGAFAQAENFRIVGISVAAFLLVSLKQTLDLATRHRIQTPLTLPSASILEAGTF